MSVDKLVGEMWRVASGEARCLVIGYHAARFYGATVSDPADHSLYVEADEQAFAKLAKKLSKKKATSDAEFSWPVADTAGETYRLVRQKASLPAFDAAWKRRSSGFIAGQTLEFLGLEDLLASFETANESDWKLVAELERVADDRRLDACEDPDMISRALANMRSVQGYERAQALGYYKNAEAVAEASQMVTHPVAQAFLLPFQATPSIGEKVAAAPSVRSLLDGMISQAEGEPKLGLVEAVRRAHQLSKMSGATASA